MAEHIWITGDTHGSIEKFKPRVFYEQDFMKNQEENFVIVCGDFGLIWNHRGENSMEKFNLDTLEGKKFTTLALDGNHENFQRLYHDYPVMDWHGGKVHQIRPHVLHLMRGECYTIAGMKFFVFGGAASHDVQHGILDPVKDKRLIKQWVKDPYKMFRVNRVSWWKEEMPSAEEYTHGIETLKRNNYEVDFILTHCPPASAIAYLGRGTYQQDELTQYLEKIREKTKYRKWFFGHMHDDLCLNDKDILLYQQIVQIL